MSNEMSLDSFGGRLRYARYLRGFSQRHLSRLSGVHWAEISEYEQGEHKPGAANLKKLGMALDIPMAWLLLQAGEMPT